MKTTLDPRFRGDDEQALSFLRKQEPSVVERLQ